uniref:Fibronectin type-III domain-containing protein n=1 Tax=Candidatus Kentrum sp. SD TaxID=2126332 RepID=A0A451BS13_9GAMM|nr:MAG: hypothetical protein BECKSD772D_GA0070982_12193 [Candidatus Kentron sp. SD]
MVTLRDCSGSCDSHRKAGSLPPRQVNPEDGIAGANENVTHSDDAALNHLGWGVHREPARLKAPGQTRHLEVMGQNGGQGDGWIALDWKQPNKGGKAAAYKIQRREGDSETWLDAGRQPWIPRPPSPQPTARHPPGIPRRGRQ